MSTIEANDDINDESAVEEERRNVQLVLESSGLGRVELSVLTKLDLPGCGLSALPSSLPELVPNLSILFMPQNNIKELPAVIGACPNLQVCI